MSTEPGKVPDQNVETSTEASNTVKVLELGIGEKDTQAGSLIAMEMEDSKKTGYKKNPTRASRKKSIDHIFGRINETDLDNSIDKTPLKNLPRRSLLSLDPGIIIKQPVESDDEEK